MVWFSALLLAAVGALNGIFSIFGLGNDTTEVNSLDVWNCIQGYVEQYVHQIVDQLHTQEINQRVRQGIKLPLFICCTWHTPRTEIAFSSLWYTLNLFPNI